MLLTIHLFIMDISDEEWSQWNLAVSWRGVEEHSRAVKKTKKPQRWCLEEVCSACREQLFVTGNTSAHREAINRTLGPTESLRDCHPCHTHFHAHDSVQPQVHWGLSLVYSLINAHTLRKLFFSLGVWPTGLKHTTIWNIAGIKKCFLHPGLSSFLQCVWRWGGVG